jgi:transposase-like protein
MSQEDRQLLLDLIEYTGNSVSQIAVEAGLTPSTLTRALHQERTRNLSVPTLQKLYRRWPDFPGWRRDYLPTPGYPRPK